MFVKLLSICETSDPSSQVLGIQISRTVHMAKYGICTSIIHENQHLLTSSRYGLAFFLNSTGSNNLVGTHQFCQFTLTTSLCSQNFNIPFLIYPCNDVNLANIKADVDTGQRPSDDYFKLIIQGIKKCYTKRISYISFSFNQQLKKIMNDTKNQRRSSATLQQSFGVKVQLMHAMNDAKSSTKKKQK